MGTRLRARVAAGNVGRHRWHPQADPVLHAAGCGLLNCTAGIRAGPQRSKAGGSSKVGGAVPMLTDGIEIL